MSSSALMICAAAGEVGRRAAARTARRRRACSFADQRHRGGRHLAQVVARHLGGQADRDAAGAVEQHERQARRQQLRLLGRAVVVGHEVDRAFVDLVEQQPRDRRQARLGVAHRRGAVAVALAEVALAVDQRVALRRSPAPCAPARRRPPGRRAGGSGRARRRRRARSSPAWAPRRAAEGQAHALHRVEDAALHRLLAVAHVGQRAALDHADSAYSR